MQKRWTRYLVIVGLLAAIGSAYADNWSYFRAIGNNVSVSSAPVDNKTYTWRFRNDGINKITHLEFKYSYVNAQTGAYETQSDVFPWSLGPGQVFGGWSAFTAASRSEPLITITNIRRQ
jgi:hypothetical protein